MNKKQLVEQYEMFVNGLKSDITQLREIEKNEIADQVQTVITKNYLFASDQNVTIKSKIKELNNMMLKTSKELVKW